MKALEKVNVEKIQSRRPDPKSLELQEEQKE